MEHKERDLEQKCCALARKHGWAVWKNEKNGNKGIPDSSFLHPDGRFFLIEFKKDENQKPRYEQEIWLNRFPKNSALIGSFSQFCEFFGLYQ